MTAPVSSVHPQFQSSLETLQSKVPENLRQPRVGIVCGSGLGGLADALQERFEIEYIELEGYAESSVPGHKSRLAFGFLGQETKVPVVCMLGRFHFYEGRSIEEVIFPIRVMALLGIESIIITNAAGSLNPSITTGTIVAIHDHIALPGLTSSNPLRGPLLSLKTPASTVPLAYDPPRFLPTSDAHSYTLRKLAFQTAHKIGLPSAALAEGTYAWVSGPTYETPAEGRLLRLVGADVVGMSTVPEVIAAHHAGVKVLVLSLVTNAVVIPETYQSAKAEVEAEIAGKPLPPHKAEETVSHEEVLEEGKKRAEDMKRLVEGIVEGSVGAHGTA